MARTVGPDAGADPDPNMMLVLPRVSERSLQRLPHVCTSESSIARSSSSYML